MRHSPSFLILVALLSPAGADASPARPVLAAALAAGSGDHEGSNDDEGAAGRPALSDPEQAGPAPRQGTRPNPRERGGEHEEVRLEPRSLSLDLGGALVVMGGLAYPKIALDGTPSDQFFAHGRGGAFRLHYDFPAMDLDWRVGLNGTWPGYLGLGGNVGIRKLLGPWNAPRVAARGGLGAELMLAGGQKNALYLLPVFVAEGEVSAELDVVPQVFTAGAVFQFAARYGLPLGVGVDLGGWLRGTYWF